MKKIYLVFVDLEKTLDGVPKKLFLNILGRTKRDVVRKFIRAIKDTYIKSFCKLKIQETEINL